MYFLIQLLTQACFLRNFLMLEGKTYPCSIFKTTLLCGNALLPAVAFDSLKPEPCLLLHKNEWQLHLAGKSVWFGLNSALTVTANSELQVWMFLKEDGLVFFRVSSHSNEQGLGKKFQTSRIIP